MHELDLLKDLVIVLGSAVVVVAMLRRVRVPAIAGFILTGVLAGPTALGLIDDTHQVQVLAEVGVILLLFGIGLELPLERLRRLWKAVLIGGGVQVALTVVCVAAVASAYGLGPGTSVFVGCVIAVSSTAVVLRGLSARGELDAPHGRLAVGILVFQDLCVVPMMLSVPFLAGHGGSVEEVLRTMGTALLILVVVLVAAWTLAPRLLEFVARTRERELFILTVFLVCFGIAWFVALGGISLALGAFLAGMVVAGSEFRHQALTDLIPAREVLASLFFISVGMLLDVSDVFESLLPTMGLLAAILVGKFVIVLVTAVVLRLPLRIGILSATTLCQVGEFSFVLLGAASGTGLLGPALSHNLLVAIILSMLVTPMAIALGPHLASRAARVPWLNSLLGAQPPGVDVDEPHRDHVIVGGYGLAGRKLCGRLRAAGLPYLAVDFNPDNVRAARQAGDRAVLGDITQPHILEELGCREARLVVLAVNDANATQQTVRTIRATAPGVTIVARTQYEIDIPALRQAGADQIVTAESAAGEALIETAFATLDATSAS